MILAIIAGVLIGIIGFCLIFHFIHEFALKEDPFIHSLPASHHKQTSTVFPHHEATHLSSSVRGTALPHAIGAKSVQSLGRSPAIWLTANPADINGPPPIIYDRGMVNVKHITRPFYVMTTTNGVRYS